MCNAFATSNVIAIHYAMSTEVKANALKHTHAGFLQLENKSYEEAKDLLERALDIRRSEAGEDDVQVVSQYYADREAF